MSAFGRLRVLAEQADERDEHDDRREQREDGVVRECGRPVGEVVVPELLDRAARSTAFHPGLGISVGFDVPYAGSASRVLSMYQRVPGATRPGKTARRAKY